MEDTDMPLKKKQKKHSNDLLNKSETVKGANLKHKLFAFKLTAVAFITWCLKKQGTAFSLKERLSDCSFYLVQGTTT